jgi:hypothetical protein
MSDISELQHRTIEAQNDIMKKAGSALVDAQVAIIAYRRDIDEYKRVLTTIIANLGIARMSPTLAPEMIRQTQELALSALRDEY